MADTTIVNRPDLNCDDCDKPPVVYVHWGPLTNGQVKKLCTKCMKKRSETLNCITVTANQK